MIGFLITAPALAAARRRVTGILDPASTQWRFDRAAAGAHLLTCGF